LNPLLKQAIDLHTRLLDRRLAASRAYMESPVIHDAELASHLKRVRKVERKALDRWARRNGMVDATPVPIQKS